MKLIINHLVLGWLGCLPTCVLAQAVEIRFRGPTVSSTREVIRLQDVADLSGGEPAIRHRLSNLDLEAFETDQVSMEISAELVRYRILLAEISDSKFHIEPATSSTVFHWRPEKINRLIEQSLSWQFAEMYRIPEEELELSLVSSLDQTLIRSAIELDSMTVQSRLPTELPIGQRMIPITVSDAQGKSLDLKAVCRITVYRNVAMILSTVAKGQELNETNIERVRRRIDSPSIRLASYEEVIGKTAQANLQAYSIVHQQAIQNPAGSQTQAMPSGVKRNAIINIIVQQGNLAVTLKNARANQNGQIGETIAFLNPVTNKIVYAKLLDANTAIIQR